MKPLCNATARKLGCPVVWQLSFLVVYEFRSDHFAVSPICAIQFSLTIYFQNCGYQFSWGCYLVTYIENLLRPLQLFYFHL
jgi:hypothetical protein